jgi:hypothetical protein
VINHVVDQRYEALEKVGDSALFAVYKARDRVNNRVVALKTVSQPYASDAAFVEALRAGLEISANLNHPNITHFYEFGEADGVPYAIVEFVRGINLKERIRRIAPFTLSVAVDFACAIGEALHLAHTAGQAHGDLRPQNIIISPEGALKVTDFGVQRAIARSAQAQQQTLLRSALYHAPELSTTQPGTVAGDIYALGAILYEMLTGSPVYAADSPEALADLHAFAAIPSPRVVNPGVPRSVEGIILKCLQKRPEQRYRSAVDLLNDLKAVRDALRFGKPLSWSPMDGETPAPAAPPPAAVASPPAAKPPALRTLEPVADVAASSSPIIMPANNRLRAQDERVSGYIKGAIALVTAIIFCCLIGLYAIYLAHWVEPKPVPVPQLVGKSIEDVRRIAAEKKVRLIEHAEYNNKPRGVVYQTDQPGGTPIHQNHPVNVWYSRGPEYVNVPNVAHLPREEAEQKLQAAGLKVGQITPEYSDKVPANSVISQDVTFKKRVFHDTAVDLVVSDGPKPDYAPGDTGDTSNPPSVAPNPGNDNGAPANPPDTNPPGNTDATGGAAADETLHHFDRSITIGKDGKGNRRVRVEYRDAQGMHPALIDEYHNEGDKIKLTFDYYGKNITLSIYYDDQLVKETTFDPQSSTGKKRQ